MVGFHDVSFPAAWSARASVEIGDAVRIVSLESGREERGRTNNRAPRRFRFVQGEAPLASARSLAAFFDARCGRAYAFRFRDPLEWKSCPHEAAVTPFDQVVGAGDGGRKRFALVRSAGGFSRRITRPVAGSLVVAVNGSVLAPSAVSFDAATAELVFTSAPPTGANITAGFGFDVPVRFDVASLEISFPSDRSALVGAFSLLEILEP